MRFVAVSLLGAIGCATVGCAANAAGTRVALTVQGAAAGAAAQQACADAVRRAGAVVDANASVQAIVTLEPSGGRLQVVSPSRGLVRDEATPAGSLDRLCRDAAFAAATVPESGPQTSGALPAEAQPPRSPTTSGASSNGPIQ